MNKSISQTKTGASKKVLCIGECMVEFFRQQDGKWVQGFAGDTLNTAWALVACGLSNVGFHSRVGSDGFSDAMLDFMHSNGISTASIERDQDRRPGLYTIETDDTGERSFSYWRSASAARHLAQDQGGLAKLFEDQDVLYLSGITLAILPPPDRQNLFNALGQRGNRRFRVVFDPNIRPALWEDIEIMRECIQAAAAQADMVLPSFDDERAAFGDLRPDETLARYKALGSPEIIVKNGVEPVHWFVQDDNGSVRSGKAPIARHLDPVDTTGAGDSFNGGYLAARICGVDVQTAIKAGQAVSAKVVSVRGALAPMREIAEAWCSALD